MSKSVNNAGKLLHVQRAAICHLLFAKVSPDSLEHIYSLVTKKTTKNIKDSIWRAEKETLIQIVEKCIDISQSDIEECFEENRYNMRPSFRLFLLRPLDPSMTTEMFLEKWQPDLSVDFLNRHLQGKKHPHDNWKEIVIRDMIKVDDGGTIEFSFSYQEEYNYIDPEREDNKSIYELKFGFVWINLKDNFLSVTISTENVIWTLVDVLATVLELHITSTNITDNIVDRVFPKESLKRKNLHHPNPPEGFPERITVSDHQMGQKLDHLDPYEGYETPGTLYEEEIADDISTTLGINNSKGKIYITRQLQTTQLRSWGLERIRQIMNYINRLYKSDDVDEILLTLDIENDEQLKDMFRNTADRSLVLQVVKGIIQCKKNNVNSIVLQGVETKALHAAFRKCTVSMFKPYCDSCSNHMDLVCHSCGKHQVTMFRTASGNPEVFCLHCRSVFDHDHLRCTENHNIELKSYYDGLVMEAYESLTSLVAHLINTYFSGTGNRFNSSEESFYFIGNLLHHSTSQNTKVVFPIQELAQFRPLWERTIPDTRKAKVHEILHEVKEKCHEQSSEACKACQKRKNLLCIMKPFISFTDHELHPHSGQEFGDVSFTMQIAGMDDAVFVGIAKSYQKTMVTEANGMGREMIQQFLGKCMDARVNVVGIICAAPLDQGLKALFRYLAKIHNKKIVMWTFDELTYAVDYTLDMFKLKPEKVLEDIKEDAGLKKRKPRVNAKQVKKKTS